MSLILRGVFCDSIGVNWNIKLEMIEEPVYADDCYKCGRIHLTDHWIHGGIPLMRCRQARD
jgi:hypothetical protein